MATPEIPFSRSKIGLELASVLANVTNACFQKTCALGKFRQYTQSIVTMHHDIQSIWTYYSIEHRYEPKMRNGKIQMETSLVLS